MSNHISQEDHELALQELTNKSVLTKVVIHSCHGELMQSIARYLPNLPHLYHPHYLLNPDQSLVVYPNHPLPTTHCSFNPDHLHHPGPSFSTRIPLTCLLGIATRTTTTPTKSPSARTATLSGVTARLKPSVFFPQLVTLFGFFMFFSLTRISLSLAVILLFFLPHNSH